MSRRISWLPSVGDKFGLLTVESITLCRITVGAKEVNAVPCICVCGGKKAVTPGDLRLKRVTSCGCERLRGYRDLVKRNKDRATHGARNTSEWGIWSGMKQRCLNPNHEQFWNYGGRGITVCSQWLHSFENFLRDMGPRPSMRHSLDRFPNKDGNYEPGNVRWATGKQQIRNTRRNKLLIYRGETKTMIDWAEQFGIDYGRFRQRIRDGWEIERALTAPSRQSANAPIDTNSPAAE